MGNFGRAALSGALALCIAATPASAQVAAAADAEEIVVTAQRTGIPVWRVNGPSGTVVLIGSIDGMSKDTRWDPYALTETIKKADQVMFPGMLGLTGSPFMLIGMVAKYKKQATLPKGQSLAQMMPPAQFQRLMALKDRGVLKAGFERKHPLHLAQDLRDIAKGKRGYGMDADRYVSKAVRKHKIKTVPLRTMKAKPLLQQFFELPPQKFVPCLLDSVALVEAGPGAIKARSDAWAERRVPEVIASPADKVHATCSGGSFGLLDPPNFSADMRRLLAQPQTTVAVLDLRTLARRGGVLDDLQAAGFDVQGPRWKR